MKRVLVALLTMALFTTACGGGDPVSETDLILSEYAIEPGSSTLAAGQVTFVLDNVGELPHTVVISTLSGDVVAASDVVQSGEASEFTVDLDPGEYDFTCRIVAQFDGELIDHYELGMVDRLRVEA